MRDNFRIAAIALALIAAIVGAPAGPALALSWYYQAPEAPVGGDCDAIAAEVGPDAAWYGEFAGNLWDDYRDRRTPFSARGCFVSEYDCRVWQNQATSYVGQGGIVYMRCRQGLRGY